MIFFDLNSYSLYFEGLPNSVGELANAVREAYMLRFGQTPQVDGSVPRYAARRILEGSNLPEMAKAFLGILTAEGVVRVEKDFEESFSDYLKA